MSDIAPICNNESPVSTASEQRPSDDLHSWETLDDFRRWLFTPAAAQLTPKQRAILGTLSLELRAEEGDTLSWSAAPSYAWLAEATGISRRTIIRQMTALIEAVDEMPWLEITERRLNSHRYRIISAASAGDRKAPASDEVSPADDEMTPTPVPERHQVVTSCHQPRCQNDTNFGQNDTRAGDKMAHPTTTTTTTARTREADQEAGETPPPQSIPGGCVDEARNGESSYDRICAIESDAKWLVAIWAHLSINAPMSEHQAEVVVKTIESHIKANKGNEGDLRLYINSKLIDLQSRGQEPKMFATYLMNDAASWPPPCLKRAQEAAKAGKRPSCAPRRSSGYYDPVQAAAKGGMAMIAEMEAELRAKAQAERQAKRGGVQ